jgi:hypothetical protein
VSGRTPSQGVARAHLLSRVMQVMALLAGFATAPASVAQVSATCEFAIGAFVATEVELGSARKSYRDCIREGRSECKAERTRIEELRHRLKLARDYLDRYCVR